MLYQEICSSACNIHILTNQIRIHPQHEIFRIEVNIFVFRVQLRRQVVTQPLRIHAQTQIFERIQPRPPALAHLFAVVNRQKAVDEDVGRGFTAAKVQHGGPEQGVEGDDVFADEMVLL